LLKARTARAAPSNPRTKTAAPDPAMAMVFNCDGSAYETTTVVWAVIGQVDVASYKIRSNGIGFPVESNGHCPEFPLSLAVKEKV